MGLIIVIYLIGYLLCYGRAYASMYNIDRHYCKDIRPNLNSDRFPVVISLFSWIGLLAGTIIYFLEWEKGDFFLKYNDDDLWEIYNQNKEK